MIVPPTGVFIVTGCGADGWINLVLTFFTYALSHFHYISIPPTCHTLLMRSCSGIFGWIHGLYVVVTWYQRCNARKNGTLTDKPAPLIVSKRVHLGIPIGAAGRNMMLEERRGREMAENQGEGYATIYLCFSFLL